MGEVEVHTKDGVDFLLCGEKPVIRRPRRRVVPKSEQTEPVDLTGFPAEITNYRMSRPATHIRTSRRRKSERCPVTTFKRVKRAETELMDRAEDYLATYSDNHERKTFHIHQDWEDWYMKPFLSEMKHKLNGQGYRTFKATRKRAETALGTRSQYNALSDIAAASLPSVHLSTAACDDRIRQYRKHTDNDTKLTRFIQKSQGIDDFAIDLKDRMTFDPESWRLMPETRFYGKDANGVQVKKGRRPFSAIMESRIEQTLCQFPQ